MKATPIIVLSLASAISVSAFAAQQLPTPNLPDYMAQQPPKAPLNERVKDAFGFLHNFYITGRGGMTRVSTDIENTSQTPGNIPAAPLTNNEISESTSAYGIAIGRAFTVLGPISRLEVDYLYAGDADYNANPAQNLGAQDLKSTLQTNTVLFKIYHDFDFDSPVIPYIFAGVGLSVNKTDGTTTEAGVTKSAGETTTGLAWGLGAGVRLRFLKRLYADVGYQFASLGKAEWTLQPSGNLPQSLEADAIYQNTVTGGLTFQFS